MYCITGRFPHLANTGRLSEYLIAPRNAGHERILSEKYRWDDNDHREKGTGKHSFFIQYTLSGKGVFVADGKKNLMNRGKAFICVSTRPFLYYFDKKEASHWEFIWLAMDGYVGQRIFESIQEEYGYVVSLAPDSPSIRMIFDFLAKSKRHQALSGYALTVEGYSFIVQLLEDLQNKENKNQFQKLDQIQSYLNEHWRHPFNINHLSALTGFSKDHFSKIFTKEYGVPPSRYLLSIRLTHARQMLKSTDLSLDKIALTCGLSDGNYLCRLFRRHYGTTPAHFRKVPSKAV